ncbi:hypothetical protein [Aquisphaera insulae]|uniref:hypothetical protein n=1 Tax=Aquisphaera insulae TaxID=2712864 RepID=UPI0013EDC25A|nr:hypothetical protein [Aquisphaera insulae]
MPDPLVMAGAAALAAAVAALVAWTLRRFRLPGGAAGVGLAVLGGAFVLGLTPRIPPREALDRLLLLVIPAAVIAELASERMRKAAWLPRLATAAVASPILLFGSSYVTDLSGPGSREWGPAFASAVCAGLGAVLFLVQHTSVRMASRAERSSAAVAAISAAGAGLAIMLSGYATGGQLGIPLAAGVAAVALVRGQGVGAVGVSMVLLFSLLVIGRLFAGLTTLNAALIFLSPLLAWAPELPQLRRLGPRLRTTMRVALPVLPVVLALWLAQQKFAADSAGAAHAPGEAGLSDYLEFGK